MDASQTMLDRVRSAREEAKRAESRYELAADLIQIRSERSIDIFGDDAASRVVEIAADARNANEELYSTYQTLIQMLDAELRPLLSEGPSTQAVKEVLELIKYLNSESNISTNFSGSFNGSSFGNFASTMLTPTIECRMIEKFWEQSYHAMPGWEAEDRAYRERQAAERKAAAEAARAEREAQREYERQERERRRREREEAEERRQSEEASMAERLALLRKVARWASNRVAAEYGGFGRSLVAIDSEGRVQVLSDRIDDLVQATARGWKGIEKVLTDHEVIYGLDSNGSVHVAGKGTTHNETACAAWTGLKDLALGNYVSIGLTQDGRVLVTGESRRAHPNSEVPAPFTWTDIDQIFAQGSDDLVGIRRDGSIVTVDYNYYVRSDRGPWAPDEAVVMATMGSWGGAYLLASGKVATFGSRTIDTDCLAGKSGIIHIAGLGSHTLAVYHDGTVGVSQRQDNDNDVFVNKVTRFMEGHDLDGRVLCVGGNTEHMVFVTTDGEVYQRLEHPSGKMPSGKVEGLRLFSSLGEAIDRAQDPEKYRRMAREAEERLVAQRRAQGVCTHCGGTFKKVLFFMVCSSCGRRKDY